jgi:flap endonuclease-1
MGIKRITISSAILTIDLHQLISDQCPNAVKASEIKNFFGRKVAIVDSPSSHSNSLGRVHPQGLQAKFSSMSIYQFMIAVRQQDGQQLMSETGETTSYICPILS